MTGQTRPGPRLVARLSGMRRRPLVVAGAAIGSLALVAAGVALSAGSDVADLPVRLSSPRSVTVVSSDGSTRPVEDGDTLRRGDLVRTGAGGSVVLSVERRRVVLAESSEVVVPDGASLDVRRGSVLLDRRRGPGLDVTAGDVRLELDPGAVRLDRRFVVQVSVYTGRARLRTSTGRQLTLTALRSVGVAGRTPGAARPLALSTPPHEWERQILPDVVSADAALTRLAEDRIDATLGQAAQARTYVAPFADLLSDVESAAPASEAVLPVAIGRAARGDRTERDRVAEARGLRADGGSWGVVAALGDARSGDVASRLEALLGGVSGGQAGVVEPAPGTETGGGSVGASGGPAASARPSPGSTGGGGPSGSPTRPPTSGPSPSPSPSSTSAGPVEEVIEDVEELVPTPSLPVPVVVPDVPDLGLL